MPTKKRAADVQPQVIHEPLPIARRPGSPVGTVMFASLTAPNSEVLQDGVRLDLCCQGEGVANPDKTIGWNEWALQNGSITVKLDVWDGYEDVEWKMKMSILNDNFEPLKVGELASELGKFVEKFVQSCESKDIIPTSEQWSVGKDAKFSMSELVLDNINTEDWETWWVEVHVVLSPQKIFQKDYLLVGLDEAMFAYVND